MKAKIIKTKAEYQAALAYIDTLMEAAPGSPEEAELELFAMLVEQYEAEHYPIDLPDPIEAIKFRMDQAVLSRKDLIPYLGSQSKVSEVLNRKRPLSLTMIRALHTGLGIPAEVLLQESGAALEAPQYDYKDYPFTEMFRGKYFETFKGSLPQAKDHAEELLEKLFSVYGGSPPEPIYCRNTAKQVEPNALLAWQARVLALAQAEDLPAFNWGELTEDLAWDTVRLSYFSSGPQLAKELLNKKGIHCILLPHLPKTHLDGACTLSPWGNPVIGLTLRYDRLDNFWFTLVHELAHLFLHMKGKHRCFFDDTTPHSLESENPLEKEANQWARDRLIPPEAWRRNSPTLLATMKNEPLANLAEDLRISPAIVAGRVRWEKGDYTLYARLVGNKQVREQFADYA